MIDPRFASFDSTTHSHDALLAGDTDDIRTQKLILTGGAALARGAVLGAVVTAALVTAAAAVGNTGNGALSGAVVRADAVPGVYRATCTTAAANGGTFTVFDPIGRNIGTIAVGSAFGGPVGFTIADGSTDFIVGDHFLLTVAPPTSVKLADANAADGSGVAFGILVSSTDASAGDVEALVYVAGLFNSTACTYGPGHSADTVAEALKRRGVFLVAGIPA